MEYKFGAIKDKEDYRDIPALAVLPKISVLPAKIVTDMTGIPHFDQGAQGACVPHARWKIVQAKIFWKIGKIIPFSPRFAYAIDKQTDGYPGVQGTQPRVDDKNASTYGCPTVDLLPNNTYTTFEEYINVPRTDILVQAAMEYVQDEPYLSVLPSVSNMKQALSSCGLLDISISCGTTWFPGISPLPVPIEADSLHRTLIYGIENMPNGKTKAYIFNSWGENWADGGNGWIYLEDYLAIGAIGDIRAYYDVPEWMLDEVKRLPAEPHHYFNKNLSFGMKNDDVKALQDCLKSLGFFPLFTTSTGFYGFTTAASVLRFQIFFNVSGYTNILGLGGFYVGPATIPVLNSIFNKPNAESKLSAWAGAIQIHEGYFAPGQNSLYPSGTRSWKNRNPGNFRRTPFVDSLGAIGEDGGFAVFPSYEIGFAALLKFLSYAATNKLNSYKSEMTLLDFFGVYAPSSDNNNPDSYAKAVATRIGVSAYTKIRELV